MKLFNISKISKISKYKKQIFDILLSIGILSIATLINYFLMYYKLESFNCLLIYLISIVLISTLTENSIYSLIFGIISIFLHNILFIDPRYNLKVYDYKNITSLILMFIAILAINFLDLYIKKKQKEIFKVKEEMLKTKTQVENEHSKMMILRSISHDLKTPLTSIKMATNFLLEDNCNPKHKEFLDIIDDKVTWMDTIVNNVLLLTKLESLTTETLPKELIPIEDIINGGKENLTGKLENRKIIVKVDKNVDFVYGNLTLLIIVVENILSNAIKFTSKDGKIYIYVSKKANMVNFKIQNNGLKIPEDSLNHIFELFYSRSKTGDSGLKSNGTGMGLTICSTIIHLHKNKIVAYNTSFGPVFEFNLYSERS